MLLNFQQPVKLKTKKIIFEDIYAARDSPTLEFLKELSSKRRAVEEYINESSSITDAIAREMSGGLTSHSERNLQKVENYLSLLENFVSHVDLVSSNSQIIRWTSELKIRWSGALSSSSFFNFIGPKFFQIDNLRFELGMMLSLYGAILRVRALEVLSEDLVQSSTVFREAAGVYHYLAHEVLPSLQPVLPAERPPESMSYVATTMSLICLAEAQAVTIRKAEEKGTTTGLLAKLHHGVTELLDEATGVLYLASAESKDISLCFVEYISSCRALHELRSRAYLAEGKRKDGQVGVAIGILRAALINVKKSVPAEDSWKTVLRKEIEDVSNILKKYEHENEFVWHDKISSGDELPSPQGNKIVTIIPYIPKRWERAIVLKT